MTDIKSLEKQELKNFGLVENLPSYRTDQIFKWIHQKGVSDFDDMSNLPKNLRNELKNRFSLSKCVIEDKYVSSIDGTVKYLFRLNDGEYIESVVMKYKYGYTICISSQVGCKMGCTFCASTLAGFKRNLLPGEMESQIHAAQNDLKIRISHIVLMGIGEPLDNYDNLIKFFHIVNDSDGLGISLRNVTVSTCGIVPSILRLADEGLPVTLTLSLHAPNDKLRTQMMPVNKKWGINETIKACKYYAKTTSRRVTFEYTLIKDQNDNVQCAKELVSRLKGMLCHVNLIPLNSVSENNKSAPDSDRIYKFQQVLKLSGINATIRRTLGSDINASCGQLRRKKNEGGTNENRCQN